MKGVFFFFLFLFFKFLLLPPTQRGKKKLWIKAKGETKKTEEMQKQSMTSSSQLSFQQQLPPDHISF